MLGRTAGGVYWMFRQLERSENLARLLEAGVRIALTHTDGVSDEWESLVSTAGQRDRYLQLHDRFDRQTVIDFLLRDPDNPSSVRSLVGTARANARSVRTALTREVWEATNAAWLKVDDALGAPVRQRDLPTVLGVVRQESAIVRGALHGTMLRNDIFDFARIGTFLERADNTARILDVKYYVLLPSALHVGTALDNVQWETILRSLSAERAFRWHSGGEVTPTGIAEFLLLDNQMPRSLAFCFDKIHGNLGYLAEDYGDHHECHDLARSLVARLADSSIDRIIEGGLHEFLSESIAAMNALGATIERDYRFTS